MKRILYAIVFCIVSSACFAGGDVFSVNNIGMDITDKSSVKAKNRAVLAAQKKAFSTLIKRLSMLTDNEIIALKASNDEINSIISDFDISKEKSSDVRYTGVFNFNFSAKKTSDFLKTHGIAFTSIKSNPVLIIPIWMDKKEEATLWEENNIWKQAWESFPNDSFLVPTKLPLGDLTDLSQISARSAISGKMMNKEAILKRYNVKDIVVGVAKKDRGGLLVYISRYGLNEVSSQSSIFIDGKDKTYGQVLSEAVAKVNQELSTLWKEKTITKPDEISYIDAKIAITSAKDLNKIKKLLDGITIINEFKENLLSIDEVTFDIYYQGSFFDFKLALSQLGILAEKTDIYSCNLEWE